MINGIVDTFIFLAGRCLPHKSKFVGCHKKKDWETLEYTVYYTYLWFLKPILTFLLFWQTVNIKYFILLTNSDNYYFIKFKKNKIICKIKIMLFV